nr:glutamate receptor 2.9 [Quercus suber]
MEANFIIDLGKKAQVPIRSFSATSPSLTSLRSPYFFRVAQNDLSQLKAISAIIRAFGCREVVPIYIDNDYGQSIIPFLIDALQDVDARISYRSVIPPMATDEKIEQELCKLTTMQTRVFIVHMPPNLGSQLFTNAKEIGMMSEGYVWIMTSAITNSIHLIESLVLRDSMQGVLGVKTDILETSELKNFTIRWKRKFHQDNPTILNVELDVISLWAYDAASALARAIEKAWTTNFGFEKTTTSSNSTDLAISLNGPKLSKALLSTRFNGLAGEFSLHNGQLQSSNFQIINVNGNGERVIAFWTPKKGLIRKLNSTNESMYSTSKKNVGPIIWPGDSRCVPKGYSIDIFKAVMETLPYAVSYKFIPFAKPNGDSAGTYNDMVYQVYLGNFDAVVGDTTIIANRSNYVDFTLPYTESGVTMVVPINDNNRKNAWVFLKPLTWDLWMSSGCFFVFIGFVVWVLEHRVNDEFRGPPLHEIGTSLWYSFSTMVFAQSSPLVSDVSRAILNVTEGEKMKEIEKAWLGEQTNCPDSNTQDSSGSLSFASFSGLFLIAGIASLSALIISVSMFLYKERQQILIRFNSESSIWRRIYHTLRIFDRGDLSSHAFRKSAPQNGIDSDHVIGTTECLNKH